MKEIIQLIIVIIILFSQFDIASGGEFNCLERNGAKLISLQGSLFFDAANTGYWQSAPLNQVFCEGSRLKVEAYSRASVQLPNGIILRLDENTVLSLNNILPQSPTLLDVAKGFIHFISRTPKQLSITTPIANAGPEGTEFSINVTDTKATLWVYEGKVSFFNKQGTLKLNAGEIAEAQSGQAPHAQINLKPDDAVRWAMYYPPILPDIRDLSALDVELRMAVEAYQQGRIDAALTRLDKVSPVKQSSFFYHLRAAIRLIAGRVTFAEQDVEHFLVEDPKDAHALALKSVILMTQNHKEQALLLAHESIIANPVSAASYSALSYAEQSSFELAKALQAAKRVVELAPNDAFAWARVAELEQANGLTEVSENSAQHAAAINPNLERIQTVLGFVNLSRMNLDQAVSNFNAAVQLDSSSPLARMGLGLTKIRKGDLASGRQDIEIAAVLDPYHSIIRSYLGKAYYEEKRNGLADEQFRLAKQNDPNDPTPYFYGAIAKQTTNRPIAALGEMNQAIKLNDNRAVYRSEFSLDEDAAAKSANLARIYNDLDFDRLALKQAWTALTLDPTNASSHRFLSDAYIGKPQYYSASARASELLQAQLLQPLNITPVQPQLTNENIGLLNNTGPGSLSINEYDALYTANGAHVVANGAFGSNNTKTDNLVASGVYNNLSVSGGQFHYQTDGFRPNNDYRQDIYDAFAQYRITPDFNMQMELKAENKASGDLATRLNGFQSPNMRNTLDQQTARLGSHYKINQDQDLLGSFFYTTTANTTKDVTYYTDPIPYNNYNNKLFYQNKAQGYQAEIQYLFHPGRFDITAGLDYLNLNYKNLISNLAQYTLPPPDVIPYLSFTTFVPSTTQHFNSYLYANQKLLPNLTSVLGISYDSYDDQITVRQQLNPKFGLLWKPTQDLTLRVAAFRTLKRPLAAKQTLEPTQVAGFNQIYDSYNGTSAWQYAFATDYNLTRTIFFGSELIWRNTDEPYMDSVSKNRIRKESGFLSYIYWTALDWLAFSSEYRYQQFSRDYASNSANDVDPQTLTTHQVPLTVKFFHPNGIFAKFSGTYVNQQVGLVNNLDILPANSPPITYDNSRFWTFDTSLGYRLPKRLGTVSFEVHNLFDSNLRYQSGFNAEGPQMSPFIPQRQFFLKLSLFY
jgi:lipoprotein NlpI